jgi:hypothetical protein
VTLAFPGQSGGGLPPAEGLSEREGVLPEGPALAGGACCAGIQRPYGPWRGWTVTGFGWGLTAEAEEYLRGGAVLDPHEAFAQGVFCSWAQAESPSSAAVLELRAAVEHWRVAGDGLADVAARAEAAGLQHEDPAELERAVEELFWRDWARFEHRLEQCRGPAGAVGAVGPVGPVGAVGAAGGVVADQAYQWVVEQLTAEDADFPALLADEPELASALYAEAVRRFGYAG